MSITDHKVFLLYTLHDCGWHVNIEKCQLTQSTSAIFVGFNITTHGVNGPWLQVLPQKLNKVQRAIRCCLSRDAISARQLACIIGQCVSMTKAIVPAKLLLRSVYRVLATRDNWESILTLTAQMRQDLSWWLTALRNWNGVPLRNKLIDVQIETDASGSGWGSILLDKEAAGHWGKSVKYEHLNYKELLVVSLTITSFVTSLEGKCVQVLSDNITTVAYINRLGGSCTKLTTLMSMMWFYAHSHSIELTARHLVGVKNVRADKLSREHPLTYENFTQGYFLT